MRGSQIQQSCSVTRRDVLATAMGGAACVLSTTLVRGDEKP